MEKGQVSSDEAWRDLLDAVQHKDEHVTVLRYGQAAAVIVPAEWYEQAKVMLGSESGTSRRRSCWAARRTGH